ncbi:IST1 homolog [Centruroides sculpturatus]|uniref:IST1 homolog n=1 Tax=Centruroides sculpturatus TaxID=218467 RepID=UPI000C6D1389|nr:IST1 homolog [Centruroides sculpturatus]
MFTTGPNYGKLKTNLRLTINRLKLLEKKKTELTQKARREIADYIANGKLERAKIRVEHIIREDYLVEAMEIVEMYCDLILARFGLIQQMKTLDEGLAEAISSIIWATPRLQADVAELKMIADQLTSKYGKPYAQAARENALKTVNDKLIHKLSVQAPSKILVEKYLIEIAKSHNVQYEPDPDVMKEDELMNAEVEPADTLIDFEDKTNQVPPLPGFIGAGGFIRPPMPTQPFNYPSVSDNSDDRPPLPSVPPSGPYRSEKPPIGFNVGVEFNAPPPSNDVENVQPLEQPSETTTEENNPIIDTKPTPYPRTQFPSDLLPELPSVPTTSLADHTVGSDGKSDEVDFDDLTKRFEELKKRK